MPRYCDLSLKHYGSCSQEMVRGAFALPLDLCLLILVSKYERFYCLVSLSATITCIAISQLFSHTDRTFLFDFLLPSDKKKNCTMVATTAQPRLMQEKQAQHKRNRSAPVPIAAVAVIDPFSGQETTPPRCLRVVPRPEVQPQGKRRAQRYLELIAALKIGKTEGLPSAWMQLKTAKTLKAERIQTAVSAE